MLLATVKVIQVCFGVKVVTGITACKTKPPVLLTRRILKRLKDKGIAAESEVLYGIVIDKLVDYAHEHGVDLIIIATHGRSGVSRLVLGSVADKILRVAHVPVLMVCSFDKDKPDNDRG